MFRTMHCRGATMCRFAQYRTRYSFISPVTRMENYYEVLNITANSTDQDIRRAFIKLSKKFHPDAPGQHSDSEKFSKICEAYKTLYKRDSRLEYDNNWRRQLDMMSPSEMCFTNSRVCRDWERFKATIRYKQFGYQMKGSIGVSPSLRTPYKKNMLLVPLCVDPILDLTHYAHSNAEENEDIPLHISIFGEYFGYTWQYWSYLTGFGLILCLTFYDHLRRQAGRKKNL